MSEAPATGKAGGAWIFWSTSGPPPGHTRATPGQARGIVPPVTGLPSHPCLSGSLPFWPTTFLAHYLSGPPGPPIWPPDPHVSGRPESG